MIKLEFSEEMVGMLMGMQEFNLYELSRDYGEVTFYPCEAYNIGGEQIEGLVQRTGGSRHK